MASSSTLPSMARAHGKSIARQRAAQILYSSEILGKDADALLEEGGAECIEGPLSEYARKLITGVCAHKETLDSIIDSVSVGWPVQRMPITDLVILRIALYEMDYEENVPTSVAINEAVELAKGLGGEDESPKFVNGLLGKLARRGEEQRDSQCADGIEGAASSDSATYVHDEEDMEAAE